MGIKFFLEKNAKIISVIELKKHVTSNNIFGIIINKLCNNKKLNPIILYEIDKSLEVSLDYIILSLYLAICLRIKSG